MNAAWEGERIVDIFRASSTVVHFGRYAHDELWDINDYGKSLVTTFANMREWRIPEP